MVMRTAMVTVVRVRRTVKVARRVSVRFPVWPVCMRDGDRLNGNVCKDQQGGKKRTHAFATGPL